MKKKYRRIVIAAVLCLSVVSFAFFAPHPATDGPFMQVSAEKEAAEMSDIGRGIDSAVSAAESASGTVTGEASALGYIAAEPRGAADVSDEINSLILDNPNRTIYFPDGVYMLSKPIDTPAEPTKSVSLRLSAYAVLRAADDFEGEALVRLGGIFPANNTGVCGSNYSFEGGIIDGSGVASGISIESGRETKIRDVSMKNTVNGIIIKYGANSGSSDADVSDVNIIGTGRPDSCGVYCEGFDNTFTNMRIGNVFTGVYLKSGGNSLENIHPLYTSDYTDYENSCAFRDEGWDNLYDFCYSDQFATGFYMSDSQKNIYSNCFAFWYSDRGGTETGFRCVGKFNAVVENMRLSFRSDTARNTVLDCGKAGGNGVFDHLICDTSHSNGSRAFVFYLDENIFVKLGRLLRII